MMAQIPALLALLALISGIVTMVIGVSVGHENASLETLIYAGMTTLFLQVFALAVTFIHSRLVTQDMATLMMAVEEARTQGRDGADSPPTSVGTPDRQAPGSHASESDENRGKS
jgi:hypothetical protein